MNIKVSVELQTNFNFGKYRLLSNSKRTEDQVELAIGLEGVVEGDQERRLPDGLQHLALCAGVLRGLGLLHDGRLLELLQGVQLARVPPAALPHQEHLAVSWRVNTEGENRGLSLPLNCYVQLAVQSMWSTDKLMSLGDIS